MHSDDHDFYGHGHRRIPRGLIAAVLFMLMLAGAMAWSESNAAATYRAEAMARDEMQKLGVPPRYEAAKKPKKPRTDECRGQVFPRPAMVVVI